jgi:glyoxylase-like metal-dependent hydrolase (beta-lactamase superfamily II)
VILLPARNPSPWTGPTGNNTFLLPGRIPTLIDAGVGIPEHLDAIADALGGAPLAQLLITHGHSDHIKGVPAIVERWPDVLVRRFGDGDAPLADNERVPAGDDVVTVLHTPGHAVDHCCFQLGNEVFCGDLMQAVGTVVIPASRGGSLRDYLASLARVRALAPARVLPAHGPTIDDPVALIDRYLRHRAQREEQLLGLLRDGPSTVDALVSRAYVHLNPDLRPAAQESVLAHLVKLRDDGKVRDDDGAWLLAGG